MASTDLSGMIAPASASSSRWEYLPGLLELAEQGLEPADLASRDFVAPQVRSSSRMGSSMTPAELSQLERVWKWLKGFRRDATLCEREPIWVPLAEIWPAPQGKAEFTYTSSVEHELRAEIAVFSVLGLGGASKRKLSDVIKLSAGQAGLAYDTRAFLTVYIYTKPSTGEVFHRIDVDCAGEAGEFRSRDLAEDARPFAMRRPTERQLRETGYVVSRIERRAAQSGDSEVTHKSETIGSWKFDVTPNIPSLAQSLKLGVTCQNATSFETKFVLPGGYDYAFCEKNGEKPLAPLCIAVSGP